MITIFFNKGIIESTSFPVNSGVDFFINPPAAPSSTHLYCKFCVCECVCRAKPIIPHQRWRKT